MEPIDKVEIFKVLADEARLDIVCRIAKNHHAVELDQLVRSCDSVAELSQPAVSYHLTKLVNTNILKESKQGTVKSYSLNKRLLAQAGIDVTKL